jgi:MinD superfamily P-loop ATPase
MFYQSPKEKKGDMKDKDRQVVTYDRMRCDFCGACVGVCAADAIVLWEADLEIDREKCTGCLRCVYVCPYRALSTPTD